MALADDALELGAWVAGRCTWVVGVVVDYAGVWWRLVTGRSGDRRSVVVPLVLGVVLTAVSYTWYNAVAPPPIPPSVSGTGEVFIGDDGVAVAMDVAVDPGAPHAPGHWPVRISLGFVGAPFAPPRARVVRWALVLHDDARLVPDTAVLPPNAALEDRMVGSPPFATAVRRPAQVVSGTAALTFLGNSAQAVVVSGELDTEVFTRSGPRLALSLPRYGRTDVNTTFRFATAPGAFDLGGLPGPWRRPATFAVQVEAGPNGPGERVDFSSPDLADPATLAWQSQEGVRVSLLRTNLGAEAAAQRTTFFLGAVVGAGAALVLTALERLFMLRRRAAAGTPGRPDPEDRPAPAAPHPGT